MLFWGGEDEVNCKRKKFWQKEKLVKVKMHHVKVPSDTDRERNPILIGNGR